MTNRQKRLNNYIRGFNPAKTGTPPPKTTPLDGFLKELPSISSHAEAIKAAQRHGVYMPHACDIIRIKLRPV